jgi:drug/metabolite transporter (DMT)-like permease
MTEGYKTVVVVLAFFVFNQCLSLLNRWALGVKGFRFPILVTMCQALFFFVQITLGSLFSTRMRGIVSRSYELVKSSKAECAQVAWVGLWTSGNIVLNNVSLVYISLSLNQIIRSSIPVVTAVVSSVHDAKLPTRAELAGLVILCTGVTMVIGGARTHVDDDGSFGIIMCFLGVVSGAYMLYTTSKSLGGGSKQRKGGRMPSSLEVSFRVAPVTFLVLSPVFYVIEMEQAIEYIQGNPWESFWILSCASVVASLYNVIHTELVGHVGPVTTTVLGQVKIVSLMLLSMFVFGERKIFSMDMIWGCVLSVVGFCIYGWARMYSKPGVAKDTKES